MVSPLSAQQAHEQSFRLERLIRDRDLEAGCGGAVMNLDYRVTSVCAENDDTCEDTGYSVDLMLEDGDRKLAMKSLEGYFGC